MNLEWCNKIKKEIMSYRFEIYKGDSLFVDHRELYKAQQIFTYQQIICGTPEREVEWGTIIFTGGYALLVLEDDRDSSGFIRVDTEYWSEEEIMSGSWGEVIKQYYADYLIKKEIL